MNDKIYDVVTVGHILVDIRFIVSRFAGPDEEASIISQTRGTGGSAANVAIGVSRLGGKSAIIAKIGLDSFGRIAIEELMKENVDVSGVRVSFKDTGFSVVIIDNEGKIAMYGFKGAAEELEPEEVDVNLLRKAKAVHIASLRVDTSIHAASTAKKHDSIVSWDPGRRLSEKGLDYFRELLKYVDIVLVNRKEARNLTGLDDYKEAARIISENGPPIVVVKRGGEGVYALIRGTEYDIPAFKVEKPVDTTGAGDAFASGLLLGLIKGYDPRKALLYGNAVAALKIQRLGSHNVPSHEEVVKYIWEKLS
ncbi:MAG: carbohydrate kinase family protein [Desulfurococcaceae archaeon]